MTTSRRSPVTREQVFMAAQQLVERNERPTLIEVQRITGGSYSTIRPHLDAWLAQQQAQQVPVIEIPAPLLGRGQALITELWQQATLLAEERVAAVHAEAERQIATLQAQLRDAEAAINSLEQLTEAQAAQVVERDGQVDQLRQAHEAAQAYAQTATEQANVLAQQVATLEPLREQLDQVRAELAAAQLCIDSTDVERRAADAQARDAAVAQARLEGENVALRNHLQALIDRLGEGDRSTDAP